HPSFDLLGRAHLRRSWGSALSHYVVVAQLGDSHSWERLRWEKYGNLAYHSTFRRAVVLATAFHANDAMAPPLYTTAPVPFPWKICGRVVVPRSFYRGPFTACLPKAMAAVRLLPFSSSLFPSPDSPRRGRCNNRVAPERSY
ncbi:hypothetical protein NGA_0683100, partial [Nannochloropsis gaditana CCMP526]|uniref:uncharacterized protein n=1 Tax=Nannochloropsis gaditana (strain CCMP526) TaxID=1093141 RepID=UPI00029F4FB9